MKFSAPSNLSVASFTAESFALCTLELFFSECSPLKATRIYECLFLFALRMTGSKKLWLVLKIFRILYLFFNIAVKCSRLFLFYQGLYTRMTHFPWCFYIKLYDLYSFKKTGLLTHPCWYEIIILYWKGKLYVSNDDFPFFLM